MDWSLAGRAALTQGALILVLFALLLAAPLPPELFRDYGALIGPVSWLLCCAVSGRLLSLRATTAMLLAVASGAALGLIGLLGHLVGIVAGVAAFGLAAGLASRDASAAGPAVPDVVGRHPRRP